MDSPDQKRTVRDFVTVVLNGIAFLAFGLGMTGWLSPFLGVGVMSIAVFYWAWEISTAPFVTEHLGRAERLTLTLILITSVFFFCGPGIPSVPTSLRQQ
jgi:type IV secretory pathway TrbD component